MIGEEIAVIMSASYPESGAGSRTIAIQNKDLYEANKETCRADIDAFEELVYKLEDESTTSE